MSIRFHDAYVLEFLAFWGNGTTARETAAALGIKRETVQRRVITPFKAQFPGVLTYDRSTKRIRCTSDADGLKFCPSDLGTIATLAAADAILSLSTGEKPMFDVSVEDVGLTSDVLSDQDVGSFRTLFSALKRRRAVRLEYLAKSGLISMAFSPHTLVRTSSRLHFRGFCDTSTGRPGIYIDIVPARAFSACWADDVEFVDAVGDADWHRKVRVVAHLEENLPVTLVAALQQEHGIIEEGMLRTKPIRAATAAYVEEAFVNRRVHGWDGPIWRTEQVGV
jgi:hypothetical protein